MSAEPAPESPERIGLTADDARKFELAGDMDAAYLADHLSQAYILTSDWLVMEPTYEEKLTMRQYVDLNGHPTGKHDEYKWIAKRTAAPTDGRKDPAGPKAGNAQDKEQVTRKSDKRPLTETQYHLQLPGSLLRIPKTRHELEVEIKGIVFRMNYDVYHDSLLRELEVDAETPALRRAFRTDMLPFQVKEVSGQQEYEGFRVAEIL